MAKILGASKITTRFQITIPSAVREVLRAKVGQTVVFAQDGERVTLTCEL